MYNNELNKNLESSNGGTKKKETSRIITSKDKTLELKNEESIKIINNCLIQEQLSLKKLEKSFEFTKKDIKHKPSDYPIYPYDSDDPEGFYSNIYNYY